MIGFILAYWWVMLIESIVIAGILGVLYLGADKLVGREPRDISGLRASMVLTAVVTFIAYVSVIIGLGQALGAANANALVLGAAFFSIIILLGQWLLGPYLINAVYHARPPQTSYEREIEIYLKRVAEQSGIKPPKLRIVDNAMPNAFAYGSPVAGNYVAVTKGLLRIADKDEILAVLGHEVGHLKHRDVAWILALSIIPIMVYFIGRSLIYAGILGSSSSRREGNGGVYLLLLGVALIAASILFRFLIAHFNRLREYYADAHSALVTGRPESLQRALAKIHLSIKENPHIATEAQKSSFTAPLFIVAPLIEIQGGFFTDIDYIVESLKHEEVNPVEELLSTHPPVPKRLRFLDRIKTRIALAP